MGGLSSKVVVHTNIMLNRLLTVKLYPNVISRKLIQNMRCWPKNRLKLMCFSTAYAYIIFCSFQF